MTHMTHSLVRPMCAHIEVIHVMRHMRHTSGNAPKNTTNNPRKGTP
jgi:hypothetical protein